MSADRSAPDKLVRDTRRIVQIVAAASPPHPPSCEETANYRALKRPLARGIRTPFMWPPKVEPWHA